MSIFVLAVGLVSIASLIPVAGFQVQRAQIDDRKSVAGRNAAAEMRTHGFLRPDYWRYDDNNNDANKTPFVDYSTGILNDVQLPHKAITGPQSLPAVAIDPCMVNRFGTQAAIFAQAGPISMPRLTCSKAFGAAADQICISQDDLVFSTAADQADSLPTGGFNSANTKRAFQGQFSWLATLQPVYGDAVAPAVSATATAPATPAIPVNRNPMILSIVVFNQRPTAIAPAGLSERAAAAIFMPASGAPSSAVGIGAGELQISDPTNPTTIDVAKTNLAVNVGEWIMLGANIDDLNVPQSANTGQRRPFFRWYRIAAAGPVMAPGIGDNQSTTFARDLTIVGPEWNLKTVAQADSKNNPQFWAFIYDGAVSVYERTVHLEGPSMWSN